VDRGHRVPAQPRPPPGCLRAGRTGWIRLLHPGVTSQVPAQTVALPAVQKLLAAERLRVVTEVSATPDAAEMLRTDLAAAIAELERSELAVLIARQHRERGTVGAAKRAYVRRQRPEDRKRRTDEWLAALVERLKTRWGQATGSQIAAELGVPPNAVAQKAARLGLPARQRPRRGRQAVLTPGPADAV
jgi:hypothetical protein